jgi:hypothetical protein
VVDLGAYLVIKKEDNMKIQKHLHGEGGYPVRLIVSREEMDELQYGLWYTFKKGQSKSNYHLSLEMWNQLNKALLGYPALRENEYGSK